MTNAKAAATYHSGVPASDLEPNPPGWIGGTPRVKAALAFIDCKSVREGFEATTDQRVKAAIDAYLVAMALNGYVLTKMRSGK